VKLRTPALTAFALLLSLFACKPAPSPSSDQEPARSADQASSFKLKIVFRGLIAFSQDSGKLRAFLVNAQYDPAAVRPEDLPPGVYHELGGDMNPKPVDWLDRLNTTVPPHFASVSFSNAKVSGCTTCDPAHNHRRSILGADLHLESENPGVGTIDLEALADACSIIRARRELQLRRLDLAALDQLDTALIAPLRPPSTSIDRRLAARIEIGVGTGDEALANLVPDASGHVAVYSFNRPEESLGCSGASENGQKLAEEVVITQQRKGAVTLDLGPNDSITIEPIDATKDVEITILNQPLGHPGHPHAHRWYYRLLDRAGQELMEEHFFACRRGNFGPPDCPQKRLFERVPREEC
jgi:hypothetical protein